MSRFRRELLLVSGGQVVAFAGAIVTVKLLTHALTPGQYGLLALSLTGVALSQLVAFGPALNAASRFYSVAVQSGQLPSFLRNLTFLCLGATALIAGLLLVVVPQIWKQKADYASLLLPLLGLLILTALNSVVSSLQSAARQRAIVAAHDASAQWLRGILALFFVTLFSATAAFALWGQLAASAVVLGSQSFFILRLLRRGMTSSVPVIAGAERMTFASMWHFAWPFSVFGLVYWCAIASERWSLNTFLGLSSVGVYQVAYQLGYSPVSLCLSAVQTFLAPILFERVGDGCDLAKLHAAHRLVVISTWSTVAGTLLLAVASIFIGPLLYKLLTSAAYAGGVRLLPLAVLSAGLFTAGQFMSLDYLNARQSRRLLIPKVGSSALAICLTWAGAKWAGVPGVFIGSNVANAFYLILIWVYSPGRKVGITAAIAPPERNVCTDRGCLESPTKY